MAHTSTNLHITYIKTHGTSRKGTNIMLDKICCIFCIAVDIVGDLCVLIISGCPVQVFRSIQ